MGQERRFCTLPPPKDPYFNPHFLGSRRCCILILWDLWGRSGGRIYTSIEGRGGTKLFLVFGAKMPTQEGTGVSKFITDRHAFWGELI